VAVALFPSSARRSRNGVRTPLEIGAGRALRTPIRPASTALASGAVRRPPVTAEILDSWPSLLPLPACRFQEASGSSGPGHSRRQLAEQVVWRPLSSTAGQTGHRRRQAPGLGSGRPSLVMGPPGRDRSRRRSCDAPREGRCAVRRPVPPSVVRHQDAKVGPRRPTGSGVRWCKLQRNQPLARGTTRALAPP